jgi:hypothetical protein
MIRVVHPGSRMWMLTFYPSRIPDEGVKKAPDPGSRIRIRNTAKNHPKWQMWMTIRTTVPVRVDSVNGWGNAGEGVPGHGEVARCGGLGSNSSSGRVLQTRVLGINAANRLLHQTSVDEAPSHFETGFSNLIYCLVHFNCKQTLNYN